MCILTLKTDLKVREGATTAGTFNKKADHGREYIAASGFRTVKHISTLERARTEFGATPQREASVHLHCPICDMYPI